MKYTNNYNLKKPEGNDSVDIEDFNNNAEVIDFELAKRALKGELVTGLNLKIDSAKKSDSIALDSSDSVATSKAVKVAYDKGIEALGKASRNDTQLADSLNLKIISGNYNASSVFVEGLEDTAGKFPVVFAYRKDGTLLTKSILSGGTTPIYTIRTEAVYKVDGITVDKTNIYDRYYNANTKFYKEVIRA